MQPQRVARPERRSRRWFRVSVDRVGPDQPIDERSMRALEVLIAGIVLAVAALLSLVRPAEGQSLGIVWALALGSVLFVVALVSLVR